MGNNGLKHAKTQVWWTAVMMEESVCLFEEPSSCNAAQRAVGGVIG